LEAAIASDGNDEFNRKRGVQLSRRVFSLWPEGIANPALPALIGGLRTSLSTCQDVLDVGCGKNSPLRFVHKVQLVGIDGFPPAIEEAKALGTHDEYFTGDVTHLRERFPERKFDACVALDVIEHLPKADGWRLLEAMEKLATRRVVIFTPNGFVPQHSQNGDLQEHLSGWTADDFRARGYQVFGMCGPKSLRGEYHIIKYQPRAFWALVSLVMDYAYTRSHPEGAAAILAVKELS
jgi:SAM-dependent methyltransferase